MAERLIPRKKLGKKAQKALNAERRTTWEFSPVTRKVDSKKLYDRNSKDSRRWRKDADGGFLMAGGKNYTAV